jgi:hypothetical protein
MNQIALFSLKRTVFGFLRIMQPGSALSVMQQK